MKRHRSKPEQQALIVLEGIPIGEPCARTGAPARWDKVAARSATGTTGPLAPPCCSQSFWSGRSSGQTLIRSTRTAHASAMTANGTPSRSSSTSRPNPAGSPT